jgi:hypothetical protein
MCAPKDVVVDNGSEWRLAAIYGEPRWETTWQALRPLHGNLLVHGWRFAGDFNDDACSIMRRREERPRSQRQLRAFHDALVDCGLSDMGYEGDCLCVMCIIK